MEFIDKTLQAEAKNFFEVKFTLPQSCIDNLPCMSVSCSTTFDLYDVTHILPQYCFLQFKQTLFKRKMNLFIYFIRILLISINVKISDAL